MSKTTEGQQALPLQFTAVIGGIEYTGTPATLSKIAQEFRSARYQERKQRDSANAKAAGQAAFDAHMAEFFSNTALPTETDIAQAEKDAGRLRSLATRARYIELGYGTCTVVDCEQLTSPTEDGKSYRFCVTHQPRRRSA